MESRLGTREGASGLDRSVVDPSPKIVLIRPICAGPVGSPTMRASRHSG
jgi:hypothetical protein